MDNKIVGLISHYFDGELDVEQTNRLATWIKESPENAQFFAREAMLHDRLKSEIKAGATAIEKLGSDSNPSVASNTKAPRESGLNHAKSRMGFWLTLAASLLLIVGIAVLNPWTNNSQIVEQGKSNQSNGEQPGDLTFATISRLVNVNWAASNSKATLSQKLGPGRLAFSSGVVGLRFKDGVEVTIEGPAEFELIHANRTRLHSGLLSAVVPPGAEGFKVETSGATVTDLGTAFGIKIDELGDAEVSVFDGEVDVALNDSSKQRLLKEGEAIRIDAGEGLKSVEFNVQPFEKLWPVWSGIKGSSGAFRFKPPWPRQLRLIRSDSKIFVLPDKFQTVLSQPLNLNITEPGAYRLASELTPSEVPAGKQLRSFLLHFHPQSTGSHSRVEGSITFDRPVVGLVVLQNELAAWKKATSPNRLDKIKESRQLELTGRPTGDSVTLSKDRHTVEVSLAVPKRFSDLVRVIVDDSPSFNVVQRDNQKEVK